MNGFASQIQTFPTFDMGRSSLLEASRANACSWSRSRVRKWRSRPTVYLELSGQSEAPIGLSSSPATRQRYYAKQSLHLSLEIL